MFRSCQIETCRSVLRCFKSVSYEIIRASLVDELKWFYRNARRNNKSPHWRRHQYIRNYSLHELCLRPHFNNCSIRGGTIGTRPHDKKYRVYTPLMSVRQVTPFWNWTWGSARDRSRSRNVRKVQTADTLHHLTGTVRTRMQPDFGINLQCQVWMTTVSSSVKRGFRVNGNDFLLYAPIIHFCNALLLCVLLCAPLMRSCYALPSYAPVMCSCYALSSCAPVIHSCYVFLLCAPLIPSCYVFLLCASLILSCYVFLSCAPAMCSCFALPSYAPVIHSCYVFLSCAPVIHSCCVPVMRSPRTFLLHIQLRKLCDRRRIIPGLSEQFL